MEMAAVGAAVDPAARAAVAAGMVKTAVSRPAVAGSAVAIAIVAARRAARPIRPASTMPRSSLTESNLQRDAPPPTTRRKGPPFAAGCHHAHTAKLSVRLAEHLIVPRDESTAHERAQRLTTSPGRESSNLLRLAVPDKAV